MRYLRGRMTLPLSSGRLATSGSYGIIARQRRIKLVNIRDEGSAWTICIVCWAA